MALHPALLRDVSFLYRHVLARVNAVHILEYLAVWGVEPNVFNLNSWVESTGGDVHASKPFCTHCAGSWRSLQHSVQGGGRGCCGQHHPHPAAWPGWQCQAVFSGQTRRLCMVLLTGRRMGSTAACFTVAPWTCIPPMQILPAEGPVTCGTTCC